MKVTIVEREPTSVAYIRHTGPYGKDVSDFWMEKVDSWMQTNNLYGRPRFGISHDDPGVTAPEKLRYDAAVEVPADFSGAGEHQMGVVPGGRYAVGQFKGNDREIGEAWTWMLRRCPEAECSSTRARSSSITRWTRHTRPRRACSSARSASRLPLSEPRQFSACRRAP